VSAAGSGMYIIAAYRDWAVEAANEFRMGKIIVGSPEKLNEVLSSIQLVPRIKAVFLIGWSWIVPEVYLHDFMILCYHPSALPKFRGGSPIQHQILSGVTNTYATLFLIDAGLDSGPIVAKNPISLEGAISDIFKSLSKSSAELMDLACDYIDTYGFLPVIAQDEAEATYFKRRTPEDSRITEEELATKSARFLFNKIRATGDPYPNAFVILENGMKLRLSVSND